MPVQDRRLSVGIPTLTVTVTVLFRELGVEPGTAQILGLQTLHSDLFLSPVRAGVHAGGRAGASFGLSAMLGTSEAPDDVPCTAVGGTGTCSVPQCPPVHPTLCRCVLQRTYPLAGLGPPITGAVHAPTSPIPAGPFRVGHG